METPFLSLLVTDCLRKGDMGQGRLLLFLSLLATDYYVRVIWAGVGVLLWRGGYVMGTIGTGVDRKSRNTYIPRV